MKVKRLPKDPGLSGWNALLPAADPAQPLEARITADYLIIGAGFAGLTAARRLSQLCPGDRIVVLDAVRVGTGPAGRNSGFMIDLPHDLASENYGGALDRDRAQTEANRSAISFALEAGAEFGLDDEAITKSGKLNAAATAKGLKHNSDYARHLEKLGEDHEFYDVQTMREITGTTYYQGGLFTPHAAMIQPARFVRAMARGLRSNRVMIFENSPVTSLAQFGQTWRATTPKGSVEAPRVILAVNGHAESFGYYQRRLMHVFTYASMTRAMTAAEVARLGGAPIWGATPADPMGTTVRRISGTGGDRIVIRNRFTYDPSMEVSDKRIASVGRDHDRAFAARFPMLDGVDMEFRWGGRLCLSRNDAPAFGEVAEGLFSAVCQNGLGVTRGTLSGMAAAELASGVGGKAAAFLGAEAAPVKLPPEPLSYIGANAFMRWGEMKAGREF